MSQIQKRNNYITHALVDTSWLSELKIEFVDYLYSLKLFFDPEQCFISTSKIMLDIKQENLSPLHIHKNTLIMVLHI